MLDIDQLDEFLQQATFDVYALWTKMGGKDLSSDALYVLNDVLTGFFTSRND